MSSPFPRLPTAAPPDTSVPIRLPCTVVSLPRYIQLPLLPEMRLPVPALPRRRRRAGDGVVRRLREYSIVVRPCDRAARVSPDVISFDRVAVVAGEANGGTRD